MGQEYTISTGWKIFMIIVAVFLIGFSMFLFSMGEGRSNTPLIFLLPSIILFGGIGIIAQQLRRKIIITANSITRINAFTTKEIAINNIEGCRISQKVIVLVSKSDNESKMIINNYDLLKNSDELAKYFKDNFKDIDAIDLKHDKEQILNDTSLGYSVEDRERKLKTAKKIALVYNIVGFGVFGLIFLGRGYPIVIMGLFYPLLGIVLMASGKGLIKFVGNSKRSVTAFLMLGVMMPVVTMLVVVISDYQVFAYNNLWLPMIMTAIAIFALLYFTGLNRSISYIASQIIFMLILSTLYAFAGVTSVNCTFDKSTPVIYNAKVLDHRIENGKHTSYLLTLSEWGPMHQQKEEDVGRWLYQRVSIGDTVKVYFRPGLLKAPWYYVTQ